MNNAQYINQTSGKVEYYTPMEIVEAARRVMGSIDLDPASSELANCRVRAARYFTEGEDGLQHEWSGNVWMNHPFSTKMNKRWPRKLVSEYRSGRVTQACCITYASTSERWFQPLYAFPLCFLAPRTNYYLPSGEKKKGVTKGSVVVYMGPNAHGFFREFRGLGSVLMPVIQEDIPW